MAGSSQQPPCRVVVTADAGIGKSTTIEWLEYRLVLPDCQRLPIRLPSAELAGWDRDKPCADLQNKVVGLLQQTLGSELASPERCRQLYELSRRQGRLVLLVDGLDQTVPSAVQVLAQLLAHHDLRNCSVVLAGRPYSLQSHWSELFKDKNWRFARRAELTPEQQQSVLGKERWEKVPPEARELLQTPRVLYYVATKISDQQLPQLKTACHVYLRAIDHMLREALRLGKPETRRLGWSSPNPPESYDPVNVWEAWKLLGAMACEMTFQLVAHTQPNGSTRLAPNFEGVPSGASFMNFCKKLKKRYTSLSDGGLPTDLRALGAMNKFVTQGLFDTGQANMVDVYFRNKSLQEFLCAFYLATDAFDPEAVDHSVRPESAMVADLQWLRERLVIHDRTETEEYGPLWTFLTDMPAEEADDATGQMVRGRNPAGWVRAISPLYEPARCVNPQAPPDQQIWQAQRSTEMIYRSWWGLEECCEQNVPGAQTLRDTFLGEFSTILANGQGPQRQAIAQGLTQNFVSLKGTTEFKMGSLPDRQGMPQSERDYYTSLIAKARHAGANARQVIDQELANWRQWVGAGAKAERQSWRELLLNAVEKNNVEVIAKAAYVSDETPDRNPFTIEAFQLAVDPVSNAQFRLFAAEHGQSASIYTDQYQKFSKNSDQPAIFLTWFDAWVFARWCRWDEQSCRLPFEVEWEYAAKFDSDPDWNYWWGDTFELQHCNADGKIGQTTTPQEAGEERSNPAGLRDILGNVWEWCAEPYATVYRHDPSAKETKDPIVARVLRGGAFNNLADYCRSAYRDHWLPALTLNNVGVRLARAE